MNWIQDNWQFLSGMISITAFLVGIAWQTRRNAKDIARLESEIKENKHESDKTINLLFVEIKDMRKEFTQIISHGFEAVNDKLFGIVKDMRGKDE